MSAAIIIALIALAGTIVQAGLSVFASPALQARSEARRTLESYREPLLTSAYELQARLHNILRNHFVEAFIEDGQGAGKQDAAMQTTLFVFGQFLAWREIIRRDVALLRFASDDETRAVQRLLGDLTETFLQSGLGPQFMIWRVEQQGIGAQLIDDAGARPRCITYDAFLARRAAMDSWAAPLERDLRGIDDGGRARLTELQHGLLALVRRLDPAAVRYPFPMDEA